MIFSAPSIHCTSFSLRLETNTFNTSWFIIILLFSFLSMRALFSPLYAIWSHLICLYLATFSIVLALYLHQNSFYPYMPFVDYVLQCSCLVYASKFFSTPLYAFKVSHCLLNVTIICIKALLFLFYDFIWLCSLLYLTFICIKALSASHICF